MFAGAVVAGCEHPIPVLEGDFSLNAANVLSTDLLLRAGLARLAPTHDLNARQLCQLAAGIAPRAGMGWQQLDATRIAALIDV